MDGDRLCVIQSRAPRHAAPHPHEVCRMGNLCRWDPPPRKAGVASPGTEDAAVAGHEHVALLQQIS